MDGMWQDLRYAVRVLGRTPVFTAVIVVTLALGIGANASIFAFVNGLVLRPPGGIGDPASLVQVARSYEDAPRWDNFSWPAYKMISADGEAFSGVAGYQGRGFVLTQGSETSQVVGELVTGTYFGVLGASPFMGRLIQPSDDLVPREHRVVVLGHGFWTHRFGADPDIVGRTVLLGAESYEVIGVAPPGFAGVDHMGTPPDVFLPTMQFSRMADLAEEWGGSWLNLFARLKADISVEEAQAAMDVVSTRLRESAAENENIQVLLAEGVGLDPEERETANMLSLILLAIVGVVLLITCSNVANLLLARASTRRAENGVRIAIGAGRTRLVRQHLTESLLIAGLATLLAAPTLLWADTSISTFVPLSLSSSLEPDASVWVFLAVVGLATGVLFGVGPAISATRGEVQLTLKQDSAGGREGGRLRNMLIVGQIGLSLALVTGSVLLGRSVLNARNANPGFEPEGLYSTFIDLASTGRYEEEQGRSFLAALYQGAEGEDGFTSVTLANQVPIAGGHARASVYPIGGEEGVEAEYNIVGPNYFQTLGIPVVRGRPLGGFVDEPERVVVVNQRLADLFWPGEDPIGKEIERRGPWRVVGVVADVNMRTLRAPANPAVYYPMAHAYSPWVNVVARGRDGTTVDPLVKGLISETDPQLPLRNAVSLHASMVESLGVTRTIGYLVGAFAGLALVLSLIGLYGIVAYAVAQRTREIGIRLALGAAPRTLRQMILRQGLLLTGGGVMVGLLLSLGLGSVLEILLFDVAFFDPATLALSAGVMLVVGLGAAWVPATKAAGTDAALSMRTEIG